ncbi:uncharacterized protein RHOBADRAFT_40970 [Rhodotorula graminis WP1]|uniref:Uncharacterized protein n=1 Tax=Rhodotorula graminis (strain WP1) TaxID=578459 RepID=A0A194SCG5_RHOGW|nr:uncharacterized protein RHOBADRAFT_40970 [Rhodotorula graminis WP1]KPV78423.1 hypothetical protein RHOBADRAFT_40970 [Rhodotorula graminis WP1]
MTSSAVFAGLAPRLKSQYNAALKAGSLHFTDSDEVELEDEATGIPFEVRYAPALAKKPTANKDSGSTASTADDSKPVDPFAPPYQQDLLVAEETVKEDDDDAGEGFVVLLNKFCVTPRHFLLVTKDFRKQTTPVSPLETFTAWSILKQLGSREKHLAFFNCGDESGASQPHKHLQFIPISTGMAPFDSYIDAHKPAKPQQPFQLPLPYANFTALIDPPSSASRSDLVAYLGQRFLELLDLMIDHRRRLSLSDPAALGLDAPTRGMRLSELSYNVVMTQQYLHLVPRRREKYTARASSDVDGGGEGAPGRTVSVNALGFAGMVLVKDEATLEVVKRVGVLEVLKEVGLPPLEFSDPQHAEDVGELA